MFKSRYQEGHCNTNKEGLLASTLRPTLNPLPSQHSSPRDPLKMEVSACSSSDQNSQWLPISLGVKAEVCSEANQVLINALTLPDFFFTSFAQDSFARNPSKAKFAIYLPLLESKQQDGRDLCLVHWYIINI